MLKIWEQVRSVPKEAQKTITGGRLNGKTDINPMWRLKVLTEQFGACGFGWRYEITNQWLERFESGQTAAFVNIDLYIKVGGEWSAAIPGTGGNMFVEKEKNGMYVSDECYKMALTDAISVACKALGVGADIYWSADRTKYSDNKAETEKAKPEQQKAKPEQKPKTEIDFEKVAAYFGVTIDKLTAEMKEMALKQKRKEISLQELAEYKQELNYDS